MAEVGCRLRESGAFIHNIMLLIARPEHGTVFGLNGQPEPDAGMSPRIRSQCGEVMPQMTHRHQCRADAIGMLAKIVASSVHPAGPGQLPDWPPILTSAPNFMPACYAGGVGSRMTPVWWRWPPATARLG